MPIPLLPILLGGIFIFATVATVIVLVDMVKNDVQFSKSHLDTLKKQDEKYWENQRKTLRMERGIYF